MKPEYASQARYYRRNPEFYRQWRADHPSFVTVWTRNKQAEQAKLAEEAALAAEIMKESNEPKSD
jgi:hypothetical protein